jgi:hypothetical protein
LDVLDPDGVDLSQVAIFDHLPSLPNQRVAGVIVGHGEDGAGFFNHLEQLFRLREVQGHRLIAHDIEARFQGGLRDGEVGVVGCGDRDEIDPLILWQGLFLFDQFFDAGVGPGLGDIVIGGGLFGPLGIGA